jgi:WD40 repeat protein
LGLFEGQTTLGTASGQCTAEYRSAGQEYVFRKPAVLKPEKEPVIHFVWKKIAGDFVLYARAHMKDRHTVMGWMIRQNLDQNCLQMCAEVHGKDSASLRYKSAPGDTMLYLQSSPGEADVIQLERTDSSYTMRVARFGEPFASSQLTINSALGDSVYVGLFVSSNDTAETHSDIFCDVRITIPVDPGLAIIRTDIGSNLEVLDIQTGRREIILTDSFSMQAPIWKKDGSGIIYSRQGLLYNYDLISRKSGIIPTKGIIENRIDHVLSFDGKWLAFSSFEKALNMHHLYIVPGKGGIPKKITSKGSSYPHSWSPDGKYLLFCGNREGKYDIYRISARGGKEIRLTDSKGVNDGPEYSPDGKYIYFNSNRDGSMRIYRMSADGSGAQALSGGDFHDWFPHVSPDGKWVVFLSYSKEDVSSSGRASFRQVFLRLMPGTGGPSKIIAYFYGGQGSINSPSWSPDSKKLVFTSYTDFNQ